MCCCAIIWNHTNGFCLWETQLTILAVLSKQSRKKRIPLSEVTGSPMTFDCNLMDPVEDPMFLGRTYETLYPRQLFLDQYEITLARPIHTHNEDPCHNVTRHGTCRPCSIPGLFHCVSNTPCCLAPILPLFFKDPVFIIPWEFSDQSHQHFPSVSFVLKRLPLMFPSTTNPRPPTFLVFRLTRLFILCSLFAGPIQGSGHRIFVLTRVYGRALDFFQLPRSNS